MDCELMGELISNFHFGVVTEIERASVEGHLAGCATCLGEWFAFKAAVEEGARLDRAPARRAFFPRVVPSRRFARVAMAAALLLALAGGAEWLRHEKSAAPPRVTSFDTADTGEARLATYHIF